MSFKRPTFDVFVRDFSYGFKDTPENDTLPLGASPDAKNAVLVHIGKGVERKAVFRRRPGASLINPTAMAAATPVETLIEFTRDNATAQLLAICNQGLFEWDGASAFASISAGVFTLGVPVQACLHKNLAFLMDGDRTKIFNGTTLADPGLTTPGATTLTVGSATGVTGDYEGYVVWVNSTRVIQSSPGVMSGVVTFTDDKRTWARPSSPPANATHWRVFCRRVDTNEREYYQTGDDQVVATASYTEAVADDDRRIPGPKVSENDPLPALQGMVVWKGYGIGWRKDASTFLVTKRDFLESFDPQNEFSIKRNQKVRSAAVVGEECLVQTDTQTFRLVGETFPFIAKNLHTKFGNVSPNAAQEANNRLFCWDKKRGPYWTDGISFESIVDGEIQTIIETANLERLAEIRSFQFADLNIVGWAFATGTGTRRRTIVAYNYTTNTWLPPITGLEFASFATFTKSDNTTGLFLGDYWGRVYEFFAATERDGVPTGTTHTATVTAATSSTLTCAAAAFYTTGEGLAGIPVGVLGPSGSWQIRRVQSNTGTVLTLDTTNDPVLGTVPDPASGTWTAVVGLIEFYWWFPWVDNGMPHVKKRGGYLVVQAAASGSSTSTAALTVRVRMNHRLAVATTKSLRFNNTGLVWGIGRWGVDRWGGAGAKDVRKARVGRSYYALQIGVENFYPEQAFTVTGFGLGADPLPGRRAAG